MEYVTQFIQIIFHVDIFLTHMVQVFGLWVYVILFFVIFLEMGCILTPFLPGDSLLFAAGAIAANSSLNLGVLMLTLTVACFSGMMINYFLGRKLGDFVYRRANSKWLNKGHLDKAHSFFKKFGGRAIVICCFIAILRTFTPFVAGMAKMGRRKYSLVTFLGSCLWVVSLLFISYEFGNVPFVKNHFSLFVLAMIVVPSLLPLIGYLKQLSPRQ